MINSSVLQLPALIGSNPLGALAAFGLLKVLSDGGESAQLSWVERDDWIAQLHSRFETAPALLSWLHDQFAQRSSSDLQWTPDDIRVPQTDYRAALAGAIDSDPDLAVRLQAQAADGAVDKEKKLVKPTAFCMVSGQQSFLENLRALRAQLLAKPTLWHEGLIGPWLLSTRLHGMGWDPSNERLHALRARAPGREKASCVAAAVWLAYEALSLLPAISVGGRERTTGFDRKRRWRWALTSTPVGIDSLRVLLQSSEQSLRDRPGICAQYLSERFSFGQGYAVFRPARQLL